MKINNEDLNEQLKSAKNLSEAKAILSKHGVPYSVLLEVNKAIRAGLTDMININELDIPHKVFVEHADSIRRNIEMIFEYGHRQHLNDIEYKYKELCNEVIRNLKKRHDNELTDLKESTKIELARELRNKSHETEIGKQVNELKNALEILDYQKNEILKNAENKIDLLIEKVYAEFDKLEDEIAQTTGIKVIEELKEK